MSMFFNQEKFHQLIKQVEEEPTSSGHAQLARAFNIRSYYARAIEHAETAIQLNELNWDAWYELILASGFKNRNELETIKERLETKLDEPPKENPVQTGLYRDLALINYFLEQDAVAMRLVEEALSYDPECSVSYEVRGYIAHAGKRYQEALESFARSVELDPGNCRSMRMIGKCYLDKGQLDKGLTKIEQALRLEPSFVAGWHLMGEHYLDQGNVIAGIQSFARALSINPEDWGSYFFLAEYFMGRGDHDIAIAEIKKLFLFEEDKEIRAEALNLMGYAHLMNGSVDDATHCFNSAVAFNPDYALGYFNLGELEMHNGAYEKAIHFYSEALRRDPNHVPSITQTGFARLNLKDQDRAEQMFRIAVELDENEFSAYLGLSECLRSRRRYKEQLDCVRAAYRISPENSEVLNYLGIAYQCNQDIDRAEIAYLLSLRMEPTNRKAANNLAYLYEKQFRKAERTEDAASLREQAIQAWEVRLLACRAAGTSIRGAQNHLVNLGVPRKTIENLLRLADIEELPLIRNLRTRSLDLDE